MYAKKIVAATGNQGKLKEFREILNDFEIVSIKELGIDIDVEENGGTFKENAYIKASEIAKHTSLPVLSDDSGLCVDFLDNAPGVHTARYAGDNATDEENITKLLNALEGTLESQRTARFVSVICILLPNGHTVYGEGVCEGKITKNPSGKNGFGYDPVFYTEKFGKTFAELSPNEKNLISHRRHALDDIHQKIKEYFA